MPLVPPSHDRFTEWVEIVRDYGGPESPELIGSGFHGNREPRIPALTSDGYSEWLAMLAEESDESVPSYPGRVKSSWFWIVDDDRGWVGFLALRRSLNSALLETGGHIGYSVRPSRRGEGLATRALADALVHASALGLERVLITCDEDNLASARTIEHNGGVYENTRRRKLRYWVPTQA